MSRTATATATLFLTQRDLSILTMVHEYDGCIIDQIKHRFWPTFGARSACYDRIARLIDSGYLHGQRLPSLSGRGSGKMFLTVGHEGRRALADALDDPSIVKARSGAPVTPLFVAHHTAVGDVRMAIEQAAEGRNGLTLLEWTAERELRRHPIRVQDPLTLSRLPIVPDGAFRLKLERGEPQRFYLEMDMGTVSPKRLRSKLHCYLIHCASELIPVLFVVRDGLRQRAIANWASEESVRLSADSTLIWVSLLAELTERSALAQPIWWVVGVTERQPLVPSDRGGDQASARLLRGQLLFGGGTGS